MARRRECACVAGALALLAPRFALAQSPAVALRYEAPDGCLSRDGLEARVEALTHLATFSDTSLAVQYFEVRIEHRGGRFVGSMKTSRGARTVDGESCEEVVGALALVVAIAIDPAALVASTPAPTSTLASTPPLPLAPAPAPAPAPLPAPAPAPPPAPAPYPSAVEADRPPSAPRAWSADVNAGAEMRTAFAPMPLFGADVAVGLRRLGRLGPSFHAGFAYDTGASSTARFDLAAAEAGACLQRSLGPRFAVAPCLQVDVGRAHAAGVDVTYPGDATRLWADVTLLGRARMSLPGAFYAEAGVGPSLSLTRPTYVFEDPYVVVHQVPRVGLYAGISAGAAIW